MRRKTHLVIAAAAAALLAGCDPGASTNGTSPPPAAASEATPVQTDAAPSRPDGGETAVVHRSFILGNWHDNPNCEQTMSFHADGTATLSNREGKGRWSLEGDTLALEGVAPLRVRRDGETLVLMAGGRQKRLFRCAEAAARRASGVSGPDAHQKNSAN